MNDISIATALEMPRAHTLAVIRRAAAVAVRATRPLPVEADGDKPAFRHKPHLSPPAAIETDARNLLVSCTRQSALKA